MVYSALAFHLSHAFFCSPQPSVAFIVQDGGLISSMPEGMYGKRPDPGIQKFARSAGLKISWKLGISRALKENELFVAIVFIFHKAEMFEAIKIHCWTLGEENILGYATETGQEPMDSQLSLRIYLQLSPILFTAFYEFLSQLSTFRRDAPIYNGCAKSKIDTLHPKGKLLLSAPSWQRSGSRIRSKQLIIEVHHFQTILAREKTQKRFYTI